METNLQAWQQCVSMLVPRFFMQNKRPFLSTGTNIRFRFMLVFWSSGYKALTSRAEVYARHIRSDAFDLRRNLSNTFTAKANVLQATGKLVESRVGV